MENRNTRSKKAAAVLGYVIAEKDFLRCKEPGALPFEKGEILQVISEYSQKWWKARNSQEEEGYIPVSRIRPIDYPDSRNTTWGAHQHTFEPEPDYTNQALNSKTASSYPVSEIDLSKVPKTTLLNRLKDGNFFKRKRKSSSPDVTQEVESFARCNPPVSSTMQSSSSIAHGFGSDFTFEGSKASQSENTGAASLVENTRRSQRSAALSQSFRNFSNGENSSSETKLCNTKINDEDKGTENSIFDANKGQIAAEIQSTGTIKDNEELCLEQNNIIERKVQVCQNTSIYKDEKNKDKPDAVIMPADLIIHDNTQQNKPTEAMLSTAETLNAENDQNLEKADNQSVENSSHGYSDYPNIAVNRDEGYVVVTDAKLQHTIKKLSISIVHEIFESSNKERIEKNNEDEEHNNFYSASYHSDIEPLLTNSDILQNINSDVTNVVSVGTASNNQKQFESAEAGKIVAASASPSSNVESDDTLFNNQQQFEIEDTRIDFPTSVSSWSNIVSVSTPSNNQQQFESQDPSKIDAPSVSPASNILPVDAPTTKQPLSKGDYCMQILSSKSSCNTALVNNEKINAVKDEVHNNIIPALNSSPSLSNAVAERVVDPNPLPLCSKEIPSQVHDPFIATGLVFANRLRNLPRYRFEDAVRDVLHKLCKFESNLIMQNSEVTSKSLDYAHSTSDVYVDKGMEFAEILKNLPQDKVEEAEKLVVFVISQFKGDIRQGTNHNTAGNDVKLTRDSLLDINNRKLEDNRLPSPNKQDSLKNSGGVAYTSQQTADASFEWNQRRASSQEKITNTESTRSRLYPSPYIESDTSDQRDHRPSDKEKPSYNRQATRRSKDRPVQISTPKTTQTAKGSTSTKSSYNLLYILIGFLVAALAVYFGAKYYYGNQNTFSQIGSSPHSVTQFQIDIDAKIQSLKENFNGQPDMTFRIVKAAIRRLNEANPKEPGIVALVAVKGSEDISRRFSRQLAEAASPFKDVVTISGQDFSEKDPDVAKKSIDDLLINNLKENELGSVFVDRLDYIPDEAALIFHTYCDHENAPYKRVLYIFSIVVEENKSSDPKDWDRILQEHLYKEWDKLGVDQISSLMSRLSVRVAAIVPKDEVSDK